MKHILPYLSQHHRLSKAEAYDLLLAMTRGELNDAQMAGILTAFIMRPMSVEELMGFREALLELRKPLALNTSKTIDMCGTGGDGKNSFNISTLSAVVVAAAGNQVVKHGNYGVSSLCGSSNVLESLGYQFTADQAVLQQRLDHSNLIFLHAPLFHPAMKAVAPVRRALGVKTFFNMLGPLVNPAIPSHQVIGVYDLELLRLYQHLHEQLDRDYALIHALDGYDEISLTGPVKLIDRQGEHFLSPEDFGLPTIQPEDIHGGETIEEAAAIFNRVLSGQGTEAQTAVVAANSGLAIRLMDPNTALKDAVTRAKELIQSGAAKETFEQALKH